MNNQKINILLISSESLDKRSSRLAKDQYMALKKAGHYVNILTMYDNSNNDEIITVCGTIEKRPSFFNRAIRKLKSIIKSIITKKKIRKNYHFFYKKENNPPIAINQVLKTITKPYDLVIVTFWQGLLSAATVWEIYQKLKCPIIFAAVDMSPITGGCHYFWDCTRYEVGCGFCPALGSKKENDYTRNNALYRREHFSKIPCAFLGNNYMNEMARRSFILKNALIDNGALALDETQFCIRDKEEVRRELNIYTNKKFVLFAGANDVRDYRKGMNILIESLNKWYDSLHPEKRDDVLILLAGTAVNTIIEQLKFETKNLGFLTYEDLSKAYSAANVFLCPSILDAGPMMVNQSLSCGVPVVSFEMGTSLEVIKGQGTGYCAKLGDVDDFTKGIKHIYSLNEQQYKNMSNRCREVALNTSSYKQFSNVILNTYNKLVNGRDQ